MTICVRLAYCQNPLSLLSTQEHVGESIQILCDEKSYLSSESFISFADHVFANLTSTNMGNISFDPNNNMQGTSYLFQNFMFQTLY